MIGTSIEKTVARAFETVARSGSIRGTSFESSGGGRGFGGMNAMERHADAAMVLERAKTTLGADEYAWLTLAHDESGESHYAAIYKLAATFRSFHKNADFVWDVIAWEFGGGGTLAAIAERHGRSLSTGKTLATKIRDAVEELRRSALPKLAAALATKH